MEIAFENDEMVVRLGPLEKLAALRGKALRVPRTAIRKVKRSLPPSTWKQLRVPGTHIPGLLKAGSYYTDRGWEFWYVTRAGRRHPLTVELEGQPYRYLVLGLKSDATADRIEAWSQAADQSA